jgi:hypothetical protein
MNKSVALHNTTNQTLPSYKSKIPSLAETQDLSQTWVSHRSETIVNNIFKTELSCHTVRINHKRFMPLSWTGKNVCMFALKQTVERLRTL